MAAVTSDLNTLYTGEQLAPGLQAGADSPDHHKRAADLAWRSLL